MRLIIVTPLGRPERLSHVLAMWRSQTGAADLVLVANNAGEWVTSAKAAGANVIVGVSSIGEARNAGLDFARAGGYEWVVFWDDDDFHAPRSVEIVVEHATNRDVLTSGVGVVRHDDGVYLYPFSAAYFYGHSTSVRTSIAPRFPHVSLGEEATWTGELVRRGARVGALPPWITVYNRTGSGHAYPADRRIFEDAHGPSVFVGDVSDEDACRLVERESVAAAAAAEVERGFPNDPKPIGGDGAPNPDDRDPHVGRLNAARRAVRAPELRFGRDQLFSSPRRRNDRQHVGSHSKGS